MSKHAKTTRRHLATLPFLILLSANVVARAQTGITSAGAYFSPKDNYQHALVSTTGGGVYEIYFDPLRGIFRDELGCFGKVVAISAFFTSDDGFQHAIVGTEDGSIREVFFDPSVGIHVSQPALAVLPGIVSIGAFYAEDDRSRIVLVATRDGNITEIFYNPNIGTHVSQPPLANFPGVQSIAGFYTPDDKFRHAIVATKNGDVAEVFYHPSIGVHITQPALGSFPGLVSVAGFVSSDDGYRHVIVATNDGNIQEIFYHPQIGIHISRPPLANVPGLTSLAGYYTNDGYRHVIVGASGGQVREVFYNPQKGVGDALLTTFGDVGVTRVELSQGIQDLNNKVPLFSGKRTLVRAYLNAGVCSLDGPDISNARITATVFEKSNLNVPVWGPVIIGPATIPRRVNRDLLSHSINFELPALGPAPGQTWSTTRPFWLRITSEPESGTGETQDIDLRFYDSVPFHFRPFYDNASGQRVSRAALDLAVNRLRAILPVRDVVVHDYNDVIAGISWATLGMARTLALMGDQSAIANGQDPPNCSSCFFIAIPWIAPGNVPFGLANPWPNHDSVVAIDATDINWSTGTLAQEPGHNLGRLHASQAHSEQPPSDPNFPYAHGEISDNNNSMVGNILTRGRYYGADPGTNPAHPAGQWWLIPAYDSKDGTHHHDYMSYGAWVDLWTSDYSYFMNCGANRVGRFDSWYVKVSDLPGNSLPPAPPCIDPVGGGAWGVLRYGRADSETARDYLVVGGTVHRDGRVEFEPSFKIRIAPKLVLTPEPDAAHDSHVRVDLLAANNEVLASQALYLPSHGKEFPFTATMPWSDRVASVVLVSDRRELGRLTRTERQLRVRLRPIPHSINGPTWLRWETTPKLVTSSVIVFSPDGGSTWQPIAIGVKGESLLLEPDRLPGTVRGKLRVLVSDGMNTESVESPGVISVPPKPPRVFISEPADGTNIPEGSHLILRGTAISPQLGLLKDRQLIWYLDDRIIGYGSVFEPIGIPAGQHLVRLEAVDSQSLKASKSLTVKLTSTSATVIGSSPRAQLPSIGAKR